MKLTWQILIQLLQCAKDFSRYKNPTVNNVKQKSTQYTVLTGKWEKSDKQK